jgi:hypothetical protein
MHEKAKKIAQDTVAGVGGDWQMWEDGDCAKHTRRRLAPTEMEQLFQVLPSAPVFTHGKACEFLGAAGATGKAGSISRSALADATI